MAADTLTTVFLSLRSRLRATAVAILHTDAEADDVLHDAFINMWHRGPVDRAHATGGLFVAVKNGCIDRLRRRKRDFGSPADTGSVDPGTEADAAEDLARVLRFVRTRLPEKASRAFEMYVVDELEYTEIARQLDITVELARTYVSRARKRIRQQFSDIQ